MTEPRLPTNPLWRPGMALLWTVDLETSNGRKAVPFPDVERAVALNREYERVPDRFMHEDAIALGGVVRDPWCEVVDRWGREFDPAGPPLFVELQGLRDPWFCSKCGDGLLPGNQFSWTLNWCDRCVYAHSDPEERPRKMISKGVLPYRLSSMSKPQQAFWKGRR